MDSMLGPVDPRRLCIDYPYLNVISLGIMRRWLYVLRNLFFLGKCRKKLFCVHAMCLIVFVFIS